MAKKVALNTKSDRGSNKFFRDRSSFFTFGLEMYMLANYVNIKLSVVRI